MDHVNQVVYWMEYQVVHQLVVPTTVVQMMDKLVDQPVDTCCTIVVAHESISRIRKSMKQFLS